MKKVLMVAAIVALCGCVEAEELEGVQKNRPGPTQTNVIHAELPRDSDGMVVSNSVPAPPVSSPDIVGLFVAVLSIETNVIMETNTVCITCDEAGCTNQFPMEIEVLVDRGSTCAFHRAMPDADPPGGVCECVAATYRTEIMTGCELLHMKPNVYPVAKRKRTVFGVLSKGKTIPLYTLFEQEALDRPTNPGIYCTAIMYNSGAWITPAKD